MRQIRAWLAASSLCLAATALACGGDGRTSTDAAPATLVLVSVDTIPEASAVLMGRFSDVMVAADSTMYVPIQHANYVVHLDRDGRLLRRIGRHGDGPGEFSYAPNDLAAWGDSLVFVNLSERKLSFFRRSDGGFLETRIVGGFPYTVAETDSHLFVGALSPLSGTAAGVFAPADTAMRPILPTPDEVRAVPLAMSAWPVSYVAAAGDTALVGFVVSDRLHVVTAAGDTPGSFALPAVRRRPIPPKLDELLEPVLSGRMRFFQFAMLVSLEQRADGSVLAMHHDWFTKDSTNRTSVDGEMITDSLQAYASIIDRAQRRVCADTPIPLDWASLPAAVSVHGDDIVILGHVNDGSPAAVLEFRRYRVDLSSCGWLPID